MMPQLYLSLKGLHVAAALIFVGGLVAETAFLTALRHTEDGAAGLRPFVNAFRTWDRLLTTPALLLVWGLGLTLALSDGWFTAGWLQAKLIFVIALSALHGIQSGTLRRLSGSAGRPRPQTGPIIVILASVAAIAILAVAKPF